MKSEIKKLSPKEKQKVLEKINNNESNKKIPLFLEARWFVVNGLGIVPVGSIPTNNLKIRKCWRQYAFLTTS